MLRSTMRGRPSFWSRLLLVACRSNASRGNAACLILSCFLLLCARVWTPQLHSHSLITRWRCSCTSSKSTDESSNRQVQASPPLCMRKKVHPCFWIQRHQIMQFSVFIFNGRRETPQRHREKREAQKFQVFPLNPKEGLAALLSERRRALVVCNPFLHARLNNFGTGLVI